MKQKLLLKTMLLLCALVAGSSSVWAADVSTLTFTSACGGTGTADDGAEWTVTSDGTESTYDSTKGIHYGTGSAEVTYIQLSTSDISGTISKIVVNASTASSVSATVSVTVDGSAFGGDAQSLTTSAANYTFTGSASGDIVVTVTKPSKATKAIYVKSIAVTYTTSGGGGSDPSITLDSYSVNAPETAVSTTTINVTYNNITDFAASLNFYESDGSTPASYDHSWLTAGINSTTKNLDYSITANTGAARTAYLKVHAVSNDADVESGLITISQAAKSVTKPEFNLEGGSYMQGTKIMISSAGNTVYYNLTTDGSTPATPTNASTEYTAPIDLGSGTTKITAIAYDTYGNASGTTTRTYTGIALASLPFSWTGTTDKGKEDLAAQTGVVLSLGSDYAASNAPYRLKFDGTSKYVIIYTDKKPENVYFTVKLLGGKCDTGSKIKVQGSADGITFDDIEEFTMKGAANATFEFATSNAFAATHRAIKLAMSSKDQNVAVGTICVSCIPIKPAKTYTTLTSKYALDFTNTSDLKAYIATEISGGNVLMTQVNKVPANTGLVLVKTSGTTFNVPVFDGTGADDVSGNKMAGSATEETAIAANAGYILKDGAFHPANAGNLPAGKAYLNIAVPAGAPVLNLNFGGETTGINAVNGSEFKVNGEYYNLAGQRVAQPTKGLYIVNGKKVIIK